MPTRSLTVTSVARLKAPKHGQLDYFDKGYPGLALRVSYGGAKTWNYFYRLHGGKQRRLSLGRYPGMSLVEARDAWRAARLAVSKGESPAHLRPTAADTFAAVAEEWLARDQKKNRSAAEVRRVIEHDALPVWGGRLIAAITRRDVTELIDGVVDRGSGTMARQLHSHLHRLFRWAVGRGILETNPMADLPKPGAAVKRDRVLTDSEFAAVWKAAEKTPWPFGPAFRLLALTAARREEIGSLRWSSEVHDNELRIPAERSKTGEPRTIPLSVAAAKLLAEAPHIGADGYVFTTTGRTPISGWSKAKKALDTAAAEIAGAPLKPWRLHDLRRTAATNLQRLGVGLQVVESILGHVGGSRAGIVGVYQRHGYAKEQRTALEAWAREIERIVAGKPAGKPAGVVHQAGARLTGEGGLAVVADVRPVDPEWRKAVEAADATNSPDPLVAYLDRAGAQLGPAECFLFKVLLEQIRGFTRKTGGRPVPIGQKRRADVYKFGAARVRQLMRTERLSHDAALERTAMEYPENGYGVAGAQLANFMKRGS
jgi:integrase